MLLKRRWIVCGRRYTYVSFFATFLLICTIYIQNPKITNEPSKVWVSDNDLIADLKNLLVNYSQVLKATDEKQKYLVKSSKCKIPSIDPFDAQILPYHRSRNYVECSDKPLLCYVEKPINRSDVAILRIDKRHVNVYGARWVKCCYSYILRGDNDWDYDLESCIYFDDQAIVTKSTFLVKCFDQTYTKVYENIHTVVLMKEDVLKRPAVPGFGSRQLSVLMIGIDSVSRLNSIRSLPKTDKFLRNNGFVEFKGYNKVNDNTFPNLMAILTGMDQNSLYDMYDPTVVGQLDKCPILWYDYRKHGFVTAYAEDQTDMNTFTLFKEGFVNEPTDYYARPYFYASDNILPWKKLTDLAYCTGPVTSGERVLDMARDFSSTFMNRSTFGFFWMNTFSHDDLNSVSMMDVKLDAFMGELRSSGVFEDTVVIFLSDHGIRFGNYTYTHAAWLESRLPMLRIRLPDWFSLAHPRFHRNMLSNVDRLTTPYDLHLTLQDLLIASGASFKPRKSYSCPDCLSLFDRIPDERSCEDAAIPRHWCTCSAYFGIPRTAKHFSSSIREAARFLLGYVHNTIRKNGGDYDLCNSYEIDDVVSAALSNPDDLASSNRHTVYLLVTFTTLPEASFQGTVGVDLSVRYPKFILQGGISRLDRYAEKSWCVRSNDRLKKYCYCRGVMGYLNSVVKSVKKRIETVADQVLG